MRYHLRRPFQLVRQAVGLMQSVQPSLSDHVTWVGAPSLPWSCGRRQRSGRLPRRSRPGSFRPTHCTVSG